MNAVSVLLPRLPLAACRKADPDLFFYEGDPDTPANARQIAQAKQVCSDCPDRAACLSFALATGQAHGIWGGTDEAERTRLADPAPSGASGVPDLCQSGRHPKAGPGRCRACRAEFEQKRERDRDRDRDQAAVYARRIARAEATRGLAA